MLQQATERLQAHTNIFVIFKSKFFLQKHKYIYKTQFLQTKLQIAGNTWKHINMTLNSFRSFGKFSVIASHTSLNILFRFLHWLNFSEYISAIAFRSSGLTKVTPLRNFTNLSSISLTWYRIQKSLAQSILLLGINFKGLPLNNHFENTRPCTIYLLLQLGFFVTYLFKRQIRLQVFNFCNSVHQPSQ